MSGDKLHISTIHLTVAISLII